MLVRFWCNTNDELEVEVEILKWVTVLQVVPVKLSQNSVLEGSNTYDWIHERIDQ